MARERPFPTYPSRPHKSQQARIRWQGKDFYLGRWGSDESRREYARLFLESTGDKKNCTTTKNLVTVAAVLAAWGVHAAKTYTGRTLAHYQRVALIVERVAGSTDAATFDVQALGRVREAMVSGSWLTAEEKAKPRAGGFCSNLVNAYTVKIRTIWRWAEMEKLVPPGSWSALRALPPLRRGSVRVTKPRAPATWEQVQAVMPHVAPAVQVMLEVQWWTGMRPGELVKMRPGDISKGETWLYRLAGHKNDWRPGREDESVVLGPEAQRVLGPWLAAAERRGNDWLFPTSKRRGCPHYTVAAYSRAVARACKVAGVKFSPYQIRIAACNRIEHACGTEAARAVLRHSDLATTKIYLRRDLAAAIDAAKRAG